jgi:hypothetical protein
MLQMNFCFLFLIAGNLLFQITSERRLEEDDHEFKDISRVMLKICQNIQGVTVMQYAHT